MIAEAVEDRSGMAGTAASRAPRRTPLLAALLVLTAIVMSAGFALKRSCDAPFQAVCYSDLRVFWDYRDVVAHRFPYLDGALDVTGQPILGTYEYPVLTGLYIWLTSLPANDVEMFMRVNSLGALALGLVITAVLVRQGRERALWWALSPALLLYPTLNWDLPAVVLAVLGFAVMMLPSRLTRRQRGVLAAVAFGLGFAAKIYPGFFVVPLVLHLVLDGPDPLARRLRDGLLAALAAVAAVLVVNLPFMIFGWRGWWASIEFQRQRKADVTTNSLWYWGVRPMYGDGPQYDAIVDKASPVLVLLGFAVVASVGWRLTTAVRRRHGDTQRPDARGGMLLTARDVVRGHAAYPWVQVSAAMLAVFFVFHKVDSPQYALWLMPFFVLLRVPTPAILAYVVSNVCVGIGYFLHAYDLPGGQPMLISGVWGQILSLTVLAVLFLLSQETRTGADLARHRDLVSTRTPLYASRVAPERVTNPHTDETRP